MGNCVIVDGKSSGSASIDTLDWKNSVRAATTAALPANTLANNRLTANANGAFPTIDTIAIVLLESILVKDEAAGQGNGIYDLIDAGSAGTPWILQRRPDANTSAEVTTGMTVPVEEGATNGSTAWTLTTAMPIVLNTTVLVFQNLFSLQDLANVLTVGNTTGGTDIEVTSGDEIISSAGSDLTLNPNQNLEILANTILNIASPSFIMGDASGSPQARIAKSAGGTASLEYVLNTGSDSAGDFRTVFDTSEEYRIQRFQAAWEDVLSVDSSKDVTIYNDLFLNSASPTLTVGDGTGAPAVALDKADASTAAFRFFNAGVRRWEMHFSTAELLRFDRYDNAGSFVDSPISIAQGNGNVTLANDLTLNSASPVLTVGDGTGSPIFDLDGTGGSRIDINGIANAGNPQTNATNKSWRLAFTPYTNSDGLWRGVGAASTNVANTLTLGGASGVDSSTTIQFWTATALNTAGTLRGTITSAGLLNWDGNIHLNSASPTLTVGDRSGSPTFALDKDDAGTATINFLSDAGVGGGRWSIAYDSSENFLLQRRTNNGTFVDNSLVVRPSTGDIEVLNDLLLSGAAAGDGITDYTNVVIGDGSGSEGATIFTGGVGTTGGIAITNAAATVDGFWRYTPSANEHEWGLGGSLALHLDASGLYPENNGTEQLGISGNQWGTSHINQVTYDVQVIGDGVTATVGDAKKVQATSPTASTTVDLPAAAIGISMELDVVDTSSGSFSVQAAAGDTINGGAAGGAAVISSPGLYIIYAVDSTSWRMHGPLALGPASA